MSEEKPNSKRKNPFGGGYRVRKKRKRSSKKKKTSDGKREYTSQYRGVHFSAKAGKYLAMINHLKKLKYIGRYDDEDSAARAFDQKAIELFGKNYEKLNFPPQLLGRERPEELTGFCSQCERCRERVFFSVVEWFNACRPEKRGVCLDCSKGSVYRLQELSDGDEEFSDDSEVAEETPPNEAPTENLEQTKEKAFDQNESKGKIPESEPKEELADSDLEMAETAPKQSHATGSETKKEDATDAEQQKSGVKKVTSKYVGVTKTPSGRWRAQMTNDGKRHGCGTHDSEIEAARAINDKCDELGIPRRNVDLPASSSKKKKKKPEEPKELKPEPKYHVGQAVWCFYKDEKIGSKHYEATITRVHPDGKYDVEWKDNDIHNKHGHPESDIFLSDEMTDDPDKDNEEIDLSAEDDDEDIIDDGAVEVKAAVEEEKVVEVKRKVSQKSNKKSKVAARKGRVKKKTRSPSPEPSEEEESSEEEDSEEEESSEEEEDSENEESEDKESTDFEESEEDSSDEEESSEGEESSEEESEEKKPVKRRRKTPAKKRAPAKRKAPPKKRKAPTKKRASTKQTKIKATRRKTSVKKNATKRRPPAKRKKAAPKKKAPPKNSKKKKELEQLQKKLAKKQKEIEKKAKEAEKKAKQREKELARKAAKRERELKKREQALAKKEKAAKKKGGKKPNTRSRGRKKAN